MHIDKCAHEDTRKAACKNSKYAYLYMINIDKSFHKDTWEAVKEDILFKTIYKEFFHQISKELII